MRDVEKKRKNDRERARRERAENPEKRRAAVRKWQAAHRERTRELAAKARAADPEYNRRNSRKQHAEHPEQVRAASRRWYARNRQKVRQGQTRWEATPLGREYRRTKVRRQRDRRRAAMAKGGGRGGFSPKDIRMLYSAQSGNCAGCNVGLETSGRRKYHVDHIFPLRPRAGHLPGTNTPENLQLLCPDCNQEKSNLQPDEWARLKAAK